MCGIAGFFGSRGNHSLELTVRGMSNSLRHRGPDDGGAWVDETCGIALSHARLAILDLSPEGHQPMCSASGRYVLVFNGEIYNHRTIKTELKKSVGALPWRGHSDTEILLAAIEIWGLEATLKIANGMFAIALWDRREQSLAFARDRFGEKPLYYGYANGTLLFGSELKALRVHPDWEGEINSNALRDYLQFSYVPAPASIYNKVYKLLPGHLLTFTRNEIDSEHLPTSSAFWSAVESALTAKQDPLCGTDEVLTEQLERTLFESVGLRMEADVPLGAFLSGGVDSSLIVALMQRQSADPIRTFSIGFDDKRFDEAVYARDVANHLHTEHTELMVSSQQALDIIPSLPYQYDEPFADSSQIPNILVSQMTRHYVTVALTGDAGDELFGGYNRHYWGPRVWQKVRKFPVSIRIGIAKMLRSCSPQAWDQLLSRLSPVVPARLRVRSFGDKIHKLADALAANNINALYGKLTSTCHLPEALLAQPLSQQNTINQFNDTPDLSSAEWMMLTDVLTYMVDDILVKVDRASMSCGLETRIPFLDPKVFEMAWRLPINTKIRNGKGKWILRQVLFKHIPEHLIERPKMGFAIPLDEWLRGPLREWAENLLNPQQLKEAGLLNPLVVRNVWQQHLSGKTNQASTLWNILMLNAWLKTTSNIK